MNAMHRLAERLRRNAATAIHGDTANDIRAAADIIAAFADVGEVKYTPNPYNHIALVSGGGMVSPRGIVDAFRAAHVRAAEADRA